MHWIALILWAAFFMMVIYQVKELASALFMHWQGTSPLIKEREE
mgnify:FL=1